MWLVNDVCSDLLHVHHLASLLYVYASVSLRHPYSDPEKSVK